DRARSHQGRALPALQPARRAGLLHGRGDRRRQHPRQRHRGRAGDARRRQAARGLHRDLDRRRRSVHAVALMALNELAGKVAVVTGAASGLGRAMALAFADEGMHLALADVDDAGLQETRTRLDGKDVKSIVMRLDVSKASEVEAFARKCFQELGAVHVVCNNAGVALSGPVWETSEAEWQWILGVNLLGVRAFAPRLIAQDEGHIVNTASVAGLISPPGMGAYCVSKHAVVTLSEA